MYLRHGSRLLEGNVRTYLGRVGNVNRGIANTLAREPEKFFAYNNGIAATACAVSIRTGQDGGLLLTEATDLQIVNGAQTTASLAAARREKKLPVEAVFVPMKLSVVPSELATEMIPNVSKFAIARIPSARATFLPIMSSTAASRKSRDDCSHQVLVALRCRPIGFTSVRVVSI
jgi:AIPR protein